MRKILTLVAVAALSTVSVFAQENGNRDAEGNIVRGRYNYNKFFDNTFIELQGGINLIGASRMGYGNGIYSVQPAAALDVNLGKWINPCIGLRLGWQGINTVWRPAAVSSYAQPGRVYFDGNKIVRDYNYLHLDFMVNVSNWWSGYKETRIWDVVPYVHLGWINTGSKTDGFGYFNTVGAGAGLYNKFRLTNRLGLSLDLRATFASNRILGQNYVDAREEFYTRTSFLSKLGCVPSALIGIHYNFGKTGWTRKSNTSAATATAAAAAAAGVAYVCESGLQKVKDANNKAAMAVEAANNQLAEASKVYDEAEVKVDNNSLVTTAAYEAIPVETSRTYAAMANYEEALDFTTMSAREKKQWDKAYAEIVPAGWNKMSNAEKNEWVKANIYAPAAAAQNNKSNATSQLVAADNAMQDALTPCADAVSIATAYCAEVDGKIAAVSSCYPGEVNPATSLRYAEIVKAANGECPDFTTMSKKETRQWIKANKDVLPKNFKKLSAEEKNAWVRSNIWGPVEFYKNEKVLAEKELLDAVNRQNDQKAKNAAKKTPSAATPSNAPVVGVGYFNTGKAFFTTKQMKDWKASVKNLDKATDIVVTGCSDPKTGTVVRNHILRKERVNYMKTLLKKNGFTGDIKTVLAPEPGTWVESPDWQNKAAVLR